MPAMRSQGYRKLIFLLSTFFLLIVFLAFFSVQKPQPKILGNALVGTHANVRGLELNITCTYNLLLGFNLISIPCTNSSNTSIANRVAPLSTNFVSLYTYNASDTDDPWKVYARDLPDYVVFDLSEHDSSKGYWINVNTNISANYTGYVELPTFTAFDAGISMFGYPHYESNTIDEVFLGMDGFYNRIVTYNASTGGYQVYYPNGSTNNLSEINPSQGYWLNASASGFITII